MLQDFLEQNVARWNALEFNSSALMMLVFAGGVVVAASILILRRNGMSPNNLRAKRVAAALALTGAVGLLLSSAALYVIYHRYGEIFDHVLKGDKSRITDLGSFLAYTRELPFVSLLRIWRPYYDTLNFVFYFWLAVIVMGLIGLLFLSLRHLRSHPRASVPV
jgi:hypothetical protein